MNNIKNKLSLKINSISLTWHRDDGGNDVGSTIVGITRSNCGVSPSLGSCEC
jgi:hypothetical protein